MLHKPVLKYLFYRTCKYKTLVRNSALFINGAKATDTFVYITPQFDYLGYVNQKNTIQEHLLRRKLDIDLNKLESLWSVYEDLNAQKLNYEKKKQEVSTALGKLIKENTDSDLINKGKIQISLLKDNLRKLKAPLWSAEETAVTELLNLPNKLHPKTPDNNSDIIDTHLTLPNNEKNHLDIGTKHNLIHFKKNENYYLKGEAAVFELGAKFYFSNILKKNNFVQFSNPDFVKSVIVEGCGEDHQSPDSTFILHHNEDNEKINIDNRLHVTGGGSLSSFFAYHAKNVLYGKMLPLQYFSKGRQYIPSPCEEDSLFHVSQSSVVQVFGAANNSENLDVLLDNLIGILRTAYCNLGYHFRLSYVPADRLLKWESLRLAVEMYSSSLKTYIEVGNLSLSGDFISKRLMFTYVDNKQSKFPHIVSGTILNVPKLLACVLEQDTDFTVPEPFKVENWAN